MARAFNLGFLLQATSRQHQNETGKVSNFPLDGGLRVYASPKFLRAGVVPEIGAWAGFCSNDTVSERPGEGAGIGGNDRRSVSSLEARLLSFDAKAD